MSAVAKGDVRPRPDAEGAAGRAFPFDIGDRRNQTHRRAQNILLCSSHLVKSSASCDQTRRRGSRSVFPMLALDLLGDSEASMARRYRPFPLPRAIGAPQRARRSLDCAPCAGPR
jgi:hypothetical protein